MINHDNKNDNRIAELYSWVGQKDSALNRLEHFFMKRSATSPWIKTNPEFELLHGEPRFTALLEKMNLADK